jgi:GNAT superfamily N-acetyltransferase
MNIEFTTSPITSDIDFLTQRINEETPEYGNAHAFAFFIRDEDCKIIAGCNGSVIFGSIYIDQLWVHPNYRGKGLGHKLMNATHDYARKLDLFMAIVATMSFQRATDFYAKFGYTKDFERQGYIKNSSYIYLKLCL